MLRAIALTLLAVVAIAAESAYCPFHGTAGSQTADRAGGTEAARSAQVTAAAECAGWTVAGVRTRS